jgi:WD40 repeat protein
MTANRLKSTTRPTSKRSWGLQYTLAGFLIFMLFGSSCMLLYLSWFPWTCVAKFGNSNELIFSAAFSPDGTKLLTAGPDAVSVWDAKSIVKLHSFRNSLRAVTSSNFSPNGRNIILAQDNMVIVYDDTGKKILSLAEHTGRVNTASISSDGEKILTTSNDGTARVWNIRDKNGMVGFSEDGIDVLTAVFAPDANEAVSTFWTMGSPCIWDVRTGKKRITLEGHRTGSPIYSAVFSSNGRLIVTASIDGTARLWDATTGKCLKIYNHDTWVNWADFSPCGKQIITSCYDGNAYIWEAKTCELKTVLNSSCTHLTFANFSPDGKQIVTVGDAPLQVRIWQQRYPYLSEDRLYRPKLWLTIILGFLWLWRVAKWIKNKGKVLTDKNEMMR